MRNKAIGIAFLSYIALGTFDGLLGVVWPAMSADFGVSLDSLGILLMVALVGFVLVSFNTGAILRVRTFHWFLLTSLMVRAFAFVTIALFPSWPVVILMIFVMALGGGGIDAGLNIFVAERGSTRQINWLHACYGIGATVGPFLAAGVLTLGGTWTWNFAAVGSFIAIIGLLVWRTASLWDVKREAKDAAPSVSPAKLTQSLRLPVVMISALLFYLYVGTEFSAGQWSFTLFTLQRGVPEIAANFWVGMYWGTFTLGRIVFGLFADRVPINAFLRGALAVTVVGAVMLWWNPQPWVGFAGLVLMGLAEAPIYPSLIASTLGRVGTAHAANAIGFQGAAGGVGGTTLTGLIGVLATSTGFETIGLAVVILAILTLVTHEILLRVSRTLAAV